MKKCSIALFLILLFSSCSQNYLTVEKEYVDRASLASTFVQSPDPAQANPPTGRRLWIDWNIPSIDWQEDLYILLRVIYNNYQEERISYPLKNQEGFVHFDVLDSKFKETGGLLTYKAQIFDSSGKEISQWQHQMWFELIEEM